MLAIGLTCGLACAALAAAQVPASAQTAPWEPATELFSHMTGAGSGGARLDEAIRTMVTGALETSFEAAAQSLQQPAPAPQDGTPQDGAPPEGEEQEGVDQQGVEQEAVEREVEDAPPAGGGGDGPHDAHGDQEHGGQEQGNQPSGGEAHFASYPVAAHAQREPCERAGGRLVGVREYAGEEVLELGVACVPADHAALDERAGIRSLARQRLRALDLPGGTLVAAPPEGLAWLPSRLQLTGEGRCPTELRLPPPPGGTGPPRVLEVTCTIIAREWLFGDEQRTRTPGSTTTVEHLYEERRYYRVVVRTAWRVSVLLDGELLVAETRLTQASLRYPVAELRAVLTR